MFLTISKSLLIVCLRFFVCRLEAKAIGVPKPQIRWVKQGQEIKQSHEYQIEEMDDGTSILIIPEVYQDDTGEIKFEAYNALGVTATIAALSVESKSHLSVTSISFLQIYGTISCLFYRKVLINLGKLFCLTNLAFHQHVCRIFKSRFILMQFNQFL